MMTEQRPVKQYRTDRPACSIRPSDMPEHEYDQGKVRNNQTEMSQM